MLLDLRKRENLETYEIDGELLDVETVRTNTYVENVEQDLTVISIEN